MANFIARMVHMRQAQGFYTWVDYTHNDNKRRRLLKKMCLFRARKNIGFAFRDWANLVNQIKSEELTQELAKQRDRQAALQRQGEVEK